MESSSAPPSSSVSPPRSSGVPALRERIVPAREVVVAEHGDRRVARRGHELGRRRREARGRATARDEVARDRDDVGLELAPPTRRSGATACRPGPEARVHVRDVQDREPVELARERRQRDVAHALPQRERLRSGGRDARRGRRGEASLPSASSIGIVAAGTLQVGRGEGARTLRATELAAPGCQTRPGAGGPSVAGRPPVGVRRVVTDAPAGAPQSRGPRVAPTPPARHTPRRDRRSAGIASVRAAPRASRVRSRSRGRAEHAHVGEQAPVAVVPLAARPQRRPRRPSARRRVSRVARMPKHSPGLPKCAISGVSMPIRRTCTDSSEPSAARRRCRRRSRT